MFGDFDFGALMQQAQQMQEDLERAQADLAQQSFTAQAGGDLVSVTLNGKGELTESAIGYLYNQGCLLIGTNKQSIGSYSDELSVHTALLGYGVAVLENLDLRAVPDGRYTLYAAPIKISGAEGAPCRAVLISEEE